MNANKTKSTNLLFSGGCDVPRHGRRGRCLAVASRRHGPLGRQRLANPLVGAGGRHAMAAMAHRLGGQVALVHALCAVLARRPAVLVDALGLALPAADAGAAGTERRRSHDRRHGWCRCLCLCLGRRETVPKKEREACAGRIGRLRRAPKQERRCRAGRGEEEEEEGGRERGPELRRNEAGTSEDAGTRCSAIRKKKKKGHAGGEDMSMDSRRGVPFGAAATRPEKGGSGRLGGGGGGGRRLGADGEAMG